MILYFKIIQNDDDYLQDDEHDLEERDDESEDSEGIDDVEDNGSRGIGDTYKVLNTTLLD